MMPISKCRSTFLFDFDAHSYLAPFDHNMRRGRQTDDMAIGIGPLCYDIGGLNHKHVPVATDFAEILFFVLHKLAKPTYLK